MSSEIGTLDTRFSGKVLSVTQSTGSSFILKDTIRTPQGISTLNLNSSTIPGTAVNFVDDNNSWLANEYDNFQKDNTALDAHVNMQRAYDYFRLQHNRKSYDDLNSPLTSYVHYGNALNNAFYAGSGDFFFGDGDGRFLDTTCSLDICGHEFQHAVTESTSNLTYEGESGALNEGISDIFGAAIENYNNINNSENPTPIYQIGDVIDLTVVPVSGFRLMSNPKQKGQPDTYGGQFWIDQNGCIPTSANDFCGVHTNSGVLDFWFYLLTNGGSGINDNDESYSVTGIGVDEVSNIVYRTQTNYLTSSSNYGEMRAGTMQAAKDLFGGGSSQVTQSSNAWYAVGVATGATGATGGTGSSGSSGPTALPNSSQPRYAIVGPTGCASPSQCTSSHNHVPRVIPPPAVRSKKSVSINPNKFFSPSSNKNKLILLTPKKGNIEDIVREPPKEVIIRNINIPIEKAEIIRKATKELIDVNEVVNEVEIVLEDKIKRWIKDDIKHLYDFKDGNKSITIGNKNELQGYNSIAIGNDSGIQQGNHSVSLGGQSGRNKQKQYAIALGFQSGYDEQNENAVSIGNSAGFNNQGGQCISIGNQAGYKNQGDHSISLGVRSGELEQKQNSICIGREAGNTEQGECSIAFGFGAGRESQGDFSVAIGYNAGNSSLGQHSIAIGNNSSNVNGEEDVSTITLNATNLELNPTQSNSLFIKPIREDNDRDKHWNLMYNPYSGEVIFNGVERCERGPTGISGPVGDRGKKGRIGLRGPIGPKGMQGILGNTGATGPLKIGEYQGDYFSWDDKQKKWTCGNYNVNLGEYSGYLDQSTGCVAIGTKAGYVKQGADCIAIGKLSGQTSQGTSSISIGVKSGMKNQKQGAIAIGEGAGQIKQGETSIAIGNGAGNRNQENNTIVINASGQTLNTTKSNSLFIKPIAEGTTGEDLVLCYNSITGEITYSDIVSKLKKEIEILKGKL